MKISQLRDLLYRAWEDGWMATSMKPDADGRLRASTIGPEGIQRKRDTIAALIDDLTKDLDV